MKKSKTIWLAALSLLAFLFPGCIADDLSHCGVSIQYRYIMNVEGTDQFATSVDKITLFVFDREGLYMGSHTDEGDILSGSNYRMNVSLKPGEYTLVAWGNLAPEYELTSFTVGETSVDDIILALSAKDGRVEEHPTHLFFGREEIEIIHDDTGRTNVLVDMMKDTNTIRVTISGLPIEGHYADENGRVTADMPYECIITSMNRSYKFDNTIAGDDRLTYIPSNRANTEEQTLTSGFVTMRELNDGSTGSRLVIRNNNIMTKAGMPEELLDADLTKLLLPASITGDLDIDDEFSLEVVFDYTNGTAVITINGWTYSNGEWVIG